MKFSIPTRNLESFSLSLAFLVNRLLQRARFVGLYGQVTTESKNCVTGVVERNLSQSQILEGIQDKNTVVPKEFFDDFQR